MTLHNDRLCRLFIGFKKISVIYSSQKSRSNSLKSKEKIKPKGEHMIKNMENIVDIKVYSKPQEILKRLGISSVNNSFYNPIIGA